MLQTLLAERFKLSVHRETRQMPVLILTVAKGGPKLKENPVEGSPSFRTGRLNLTGDGATIAEMTAFLSRQLRAPILDQTGLKAKYNYFLDINAFLTEEMRQTIPREGLPLETPVFVSKAMQEQLGLKLDSSKAPIEVLVVDSVEKRPSDN